MTNQLLTVEECRRILRKGRRQTYQLVAEGVIPSLRLGKSIRIPHDKLMDWLNEQADLTKGP